MSKPLPSLTDPQWAVLYHLAVSQMNSTDGKTVRQLLGLPKAGRIELKGDFGSMVEYQASDGFYYITGAGLDAVTARQRLLDPQTLAERLEAIQAGMKALLSSGLNRRAIVVLLKDQCPTVNKGDITAVLDGLETLATCYTKRL